MELLFRQKSSIRCSSRFSPRSEPELVSLSPRSRRLSRNTRVRLPSGAPLAKEPPSPSVFPVSAMARPIGDAGAAHPPAARAGRLFIRDSRHQLDVSRRMVLPTHVGDFLFSTPPVRGVARLPFIISCPI